MGITAGTALVEALGDDVDRLLGAEPEVRDDAYDSVHQMRVATRRLRSVLRSYRKLLRKEPVTEMKDELKWLADLLGVARDAEVRAERFAALLTKRVPEDTPADEVDAATRRLVTAEKTHYTAAHAEVLAALDSDRYRALSERLTHWRTEPPLRTKRAEDSAKRYFRYVLDLDRGLVEGQVRAEPTIDPAHRIEHLHNIRKSAKRLRYSCEAAEPVLGEAASTVGARAKRLQTVLGEHRDAVESRETILERAAAARAAGEPTGIYERLAAAETAAADKELERYPEAADAVLSA